MIKRKRTVFVGSVLSSKVALETLIENNVNIDLVCSLDEAASKNVTDYFPIHEIAKLNGIPYIKFHKVNSDDVVNKISEVNPDFIFVIGLSQIISKQLLNLANEYVIGFHPTPLPKHRGRAAIPWQIILGVENSKVTLFKIDEGMDSGDIIIQYPYTINKSDYAMDVYNKVCNAMKTALIEAIPKIYSNQVNFIKQNHDEATYLLTRRPEDGKIDWNQSAKDIETLVRATSKPYPGAFTIYKESKVKIWKARYVENNRYIGFPGQIAWIENGEIAVVTKDGLLIIEEYEIENVHSKLLVGHKFL